MLYLLFHIQVVILLRTMMDSIAHEVVIDKQLTKVLSLTNAHLEPSVVYLLS